MQGCEPTVGSQAETLFGSRFLVFVTRRETSRSDAFPTANALPLLGGQPNFPFARCRVLQRDLPGRVSGCPLVQRFQ